MKPGTAMRPRPSIVRSPAISTVGADDRVAADRDVGLHQRSCDEIEQSHVGDDEIGWLRAFALRDPPPESVCDHDVPCGLSRSSPAAAFSVVDMDDAGAIHLKAAYLGTRAQIRHDAAGPRPHTKIDGAAGQMEGMPGTARPAVVASAPVGRISTLTAPNRAAISAITSRRSPGRHDSRRTGRRMMALGDAWSERLPRLSSVSSGSALLPGRLA